MTIAAELPEIPAPGHRRNWRDMLSAWLPTGGSARLRSVVQDPFSSSNGSSQLVVTAILVVPAWIALAVAAVLLPGSVGGSLTSPASARILEMLAGELAVAAALLSAMKAWAARDVAPALIGGAFAVYGIRTLLELSTSGSQEPSPAAAGQAVGSACLVVAFGLVLLSVVHEPGKGRARHPLTFWVCTLILGLATLTIARPAGSGVLTGSATGDTAANLIVTATWAGLGIGAIYIGRSERAQLKIWIGFTAVCLAQARLALVVINNESLAQMASITFQTIAIAVILIGTIRALQETINQSHGMLRESLLAFEGSETRRRIEADAHEEVVHNLRCALTSIGTATHLLVTDRAVPLEESDRSQLTAALQSELARASRLLSQEWDTGRKPFDLLDVITPLVANERAQGSAVEMDIPEHTSVLGNPDLTYEVIATILHNARRHAAGSPVTIRTEVHEASVSVAIEDRGPGLPVSSTDRIFERGWTTSGTGEGKGVGLFVARRLMEEQGGELVGANRPGGGASFSLRFAVAQAGEGSTPPGADRPEPDLSADDDAA
jgi:signal transduction histidine kinase